MNSENLDVADSTDWLTTPLSGLSPVEAALRCQICKDFYKTPMLTSCNHTFCSLCIRRALSTDGKCPLCRASEQEMKLRSNWSMEEVVAAFTQTRTAVLDFARKPPPPSIARAETPKRRMVNMEEEEEVEELQQRASKRLRSSARLSKTRSMETTAEMARQEAHIPDTEPDFEPEPVEPNDGLVPCPICWKRMKPLQVDRHIDTSCPGVPQPTPQPPVLTPRRRVAASSITSAFAPSNTNTKPTPPPERLPTLNYSMIKEAQLRRELSERGISTSGNRGMLERRHREWVMIWNANCDSQRPRRRAELQHDLDIWERTLGSRAPVATALASGSSSSTNGAQIRDKDFNGAAWAAKHDSSFRDLIANARRTRAQAESKTETETKTQAQAQAEKPDDDSNRGDAERPIAELSSMPVLLETKRVVINLVDDPPPPSPPSATGMMKNLDNERGKEREMERESVPPI